MIETPERAHTLSGVISLFFFLMKDNMNADYERWLELQTKQVIANITPLVRKEDDLPLLHLSPENGIKNFIPRLPENRADNDSMTVPRVCVSRDIIGAVLAHGRMPFDAALNGVWKYYIYAFDWEFAVIPTDKIAGISTSTVGTELWLVNYNKEHIYIKARVIGELSIIGVLTTPSNKAQEDASIVLNCVIKAKETIDFYKEGDMRLEKGQGYLFTLNPHAKSYGRYDEDTLRLKAINGDRYTDELKRSVKPRSVLQLQL